MSSDVSACARRAIGGICRANAGSRRGATPWRHAAAPRAEIESALFAPADANSGSPVDVYSHRLRRLAEQEGGEAPSAEEKQRMLREARRLLQGLLGKLLDNDDDKDDD